MATKNETNVSAADLRPKNSSKLPVWQAFSKMQKYEQGGKQWQKLTNSITNCLAKDMMPLYTVEKSGFKQLLNDFDLKYDIPSRKYFSQQAIPKLYNEAKEGVLR